MKCTITRYLLMGSLFLWCIPFLQAQRAAIKNQTIRGYVTDRSTGKGLSNASVRLLNYHPIIGTTSDANGYFELQEVAIGNQRLQIGLDGYYETIYPLLVVGGKQAVIMVALEEIIQMTIITVDDKRIGKAENRYRNSKQETVDPMNVGSARPVNIEETQRYINGFNDPVRSITNIPGLFAADDSHNDLISRGNTSYGIQYRVEDVPIENPHHFAFIGATGGVFPIISTNVLDNSDFANGVLSAQYGNAYAGVFDMNLRKGNNREHEFMGQVNFLEAEVTAERPWPKVKALI